ncbi:MAG: PLP-dependent aspartate aminotransferase family protein [Candidatus Aminicenantes bacterium]
MKNHKNATMDTRVIHAGPENPDPAYGGVTVPIHQTSTFVFKNAGQGAARFSGEEEGYIYTRIGNPTIDALGESMAQLENGYNGLSTSSGMSALLTILMALLDKDSHMISTAAVYGVSRMLVETFFTKFGLQSDYIDTSDIQNIENVLRPNTKVLMVETPANPTMILTDIRACAELAKENGIILVVDNTFASPILQNPLDLGADIVYHSVTKFINGHSDVVGGIIVPKNQQLYDSLKQSLSYTGGNMDPHQAWLVLRGLRTLSMRVHQSQRSAMKLAQFLQDHPKVEWVNYPGLESHPQHGLAKLQMRGFGALLCFGLKGGFKAGETLINSVKIPALAVSLGGVESLIQHPASMTHAAIHKEKREKAGISDDLIRLSVGCEGYEDLEADLKSAIEQT